MEKQQLIESLLAKSYVDENNKNSQVNFYLSNHTKCVVNLSYYAFNRIIENIDCISSTYNYERAINEMLMAAMLHDIGKATTEFQSHIKKWKINEDGVEAFKLTKDNGDYKHHHFISWAYINCMLMNNNNYCSVSGCSAWRKAVLYHHAFEARCYDDTSTSILNMASAEDIETLNLFVDYMKDYIKDTFNINLPYVHTDKYDGNNITPNGLRNDTLYDKELQNYRKCSNIQDTMLRQCLSGIYRAVLIFADRTVSSNKWDNEVILANDSNYMDKIWRQYIECTNIKNHDVNHFLSCGYDNVRLQSQINILNEIKDKKNVIIPANAGFGKTLLGVMDFITNNKKLIWVVPNNTIASSVCRSILQELNKIEENNINVTLFFGGEIKHQNFTSVNAEDALWDTDILVTNIDSLLGRNINNQLAAYLMTAYTSTIVFDEFHEFRCSEPMFPAFISLLQTRMYVSHARTILLSATPLTTLEQFSLYDIYCVKNVPILYGDTKIKFSVTTSEELNDNLPKEDAFVILDSIKKAQMAYLGYKGRCSDDDTMLFHARYVDARRKELNDLVYHKHGKHSEVSGRNLVISTSVIGTGLDISAKKIYDKVISPEYSIQRGCGRAGRFNEYEEKNGYSIEYVAVIDENCPHMVSDGVYSAKLWKKWVNALKELDGKIITKSDFYSIYNKFNEDNKKEINELNNELYIKGYELLTDLTSSKGSGVSKKQTDIKMTGTKPGFRGMSNTVFVSAIDDQTSVWCEPVAVDFDVVSKFTDEHGNDELTKRQERKDAMANAEMFNYDNSSLKYKYGISSKNDYSLVNCKKFAYKSDTPILLFTARYNDELGLYEKSLNK